MGQRSQGLRGVTLVQRFCAASPEGQCGRNPIDRLKNLHLDLPWLTQRPRVDRRFRTYVIRNTAVGGGSRKACPRALNCLFRKPESSGPRCSGGPNRSPSVLEPFGELIFSTKPAFGARRRGGMVAALSGAHDDHPGKQNRPSLVSPPFDPRARCGARDRSHHAWLGFRPGGAAAL